MADWRSCHSPLRFCQSGRVICGRGYSGSGVPVSAWAVHGVVSGEGRAGMADAGAAATSVAAMSAATVAEAGRMRRRAGMVVSVGTGRRRPAADAVRRRLLYLNIGPRACQQKSVPPE